MLWKKQFPKENIIFETDNGILYNADCIQIMKKIPDNTINTIITSPPYNKKSKNKKFQLWKNANIDYEVYSDDMDEKEYQKWQKKCVNEMIRILKNDGSLFYNHKYRLVNNKGIFPNEWLSEFIIRQMIIWNRKNTPNIEKTRFFPITEYIYWITKEAKTPKFYKDRIKFKSEIWEFNFDNKNSHPAPFPEILPENCILATTNENDIIFDPFMGSGTVAVVAEKLNRRWIGIELNPKYCNMTIERVTKIIKNKNNKINELF